MSPSSRLKIGSNLVAAAFAISLLLWAAHAAMVATGEATGSRHGLLMSMAVVATSAAGLASCVRTLGARTGLGVLACARALGAAGGRKNGD